MEKLSLPNVALNPSNGYTIPKNKLLKLVHNDDTRAAEIPLNSSFKKLRDTVRKCFPHLKWVLIQYKDSEGDFMTITGTSQVRLAESSVDNDSVLRLRLIEVNKEAEPDSELDEDEDKVNPVKVNPVLNYAQILMKICKHGDDSDSELDELDPVAQNFFHLATSKYEESHISNYFESGNMLMSKAQKMLENIHATTTDVQLNSNAYDSVVETYKMAGRNYKLCLNFNPHLFEPLLALGQQQIELAKLVGWQVLAKWEDPDEVISLFNSAEENMTAATEAWKKRANESEDMTRQIHLFWGNMLLERSQTKFVLDGLPGWNSDLLSAFSKFKIAGLSDDDNWKVISQHDSFV